ncbi:MAG: acetylxylan esterase, partial [Planctomycetota bacterium]
IPVEAIEVSRTEFDSMLRREIDITLRRSGPSLTMSMLVYTPRSAANKPCPLFLGLNFGGNHTVDPNPSIRITQSWVSNRRDETTNRNQATSLGRGRAAKRWPIESIVDAGYGLATIHYSDIDPDFDDGFENGMHGLFRDWAYDVPKLQRWGSIAAWAYGLSRAMDVLVDDPLVASDQVAVFGHSRLGKTALWAGAMDERFALVISNNSGCGGAALSRRAVGETVGKINRTFPHWFADEFNDYNENESELPVDQHQLISLIAPRPVYVASATKDRWADPKGEYLSALAASPVYRLFGLQGISSSSRDDSMPPPDQSLQSGMIGYHLRSGKHDVTLYDWDQYIRFADRVMQPPPSATQHAN